MSMTYEDIAHDMALEELHHEEVMRKARISQCIYLFVEGNSEEVAIPILLERCGLNLDELGISVANYNGVRNLRHALRLLNKTLSHDRPVVVTFDNDKEGIAEERKLKQMDIDSDLIHYFKIPSHNVVNFDIHKGGSFEESFPLDDFIDSCFSSEIMSPNLVSQRNEFLSSFDSEKPWYSQVIQFCTKNNYHEFANKKVLLAENLANNCGLIPQTYLKLAEVLVEIRNQNPVLHPDDIDLQQFMV